MSKISVNVGEELFQFTSMNDWIRKAQLAFREHGHTSESTLCVDSEGLICTWGKMFRVAKYPIRVYAIDDPPYKPHGMLGKREQTDERFAEDA